MIKIIPNRVACDNCKVHLKYEQSDIETVIDEEIIPIWDKNSHRQYITMQSQRKTIICPNCKHVIIL